jgi:hypothetical protein
MNYAFIFLNLLWVLVGTSHGQDKPDGDEERKFVSRATEFASTIFTLAGERFAANKKRGEKWIFTTHDSLEEERTIRYTDGVFIVASIPNILPKYEGYCKFISSYHTFNLHEADSNAEKGEYAEARRWYKALLHFDVCGTFQDDLTRRLSLLDKIEKGEEADAAKAEIKKLASEVPFSPLAGFDSEPIKTVQSVLDIPVTKVPRESGGNP